MNCCWTANGRLPVSTTIAVGVGDWLVGVAESCGVLGCCGSDGTCAAESKVGGGGGVGLVDGAVQLISRKNRNRIESDGRDI